MVAQNRVAQNRVAQNKNYAQKCIIHGFLPEAVDIIRNPFGPDFPAKSRANSRPPGTSKPAPFTAV
jgi:hypothetical protein